MLQDYAFAIEHLNSENFPEHLERLTNYQRFLFRMYVTMERILLSMTHELTFVAAHLRSVPWLGTSNSL
jgi:hypothetical protein